MNPIEKDLKNYYGTSSDSDILEHYGTKRHSGRYPWGSGDNPYQHSGDFLSRVETLKKKGMSENEILDQINSTLPKEYQLGLTEFRVARRKAIHERKASEYEKIAALKEQGLGWKAIGEKLGMSESSVRSKYAGTADKKAQRAENIADTLKKEVDKKGMIDISVAGNIFAAPGPQSCVEAIKMADKGHGVLFVVLNHAGDMLTGNLTMKQVKKLGIKVAKVVTQEDVANAPRSNADDRRGLVGCIPLYKIAGAAAAQGKSLEEVAEIAQRFADNMATIAVA